MSFRALEREKLTPDVHRLDLTGNLLQTWQDVAEIARHLHGLKTLFLRWVIRAV